MRSCYNYTLANVGNDATDSDAVSEDGVTGQSGTTPFLASGESDLTLDAGVVCAISVTVSDPFTVCSTQPIDLTPGASITPASLGGFWTSDGDGIFLDSDGDVVVGPEGVYGCRAVLAGAGGCAAGVRYPNA